MQTSINKAGQPIGVAGQLSSMQEGSDIASRFQGEATAVMPFGIGVKPGSTFRKVLLPTAQNSVIEGIVLHSMAHVPGVTGDLDQVSGGLKPNAGLDLLRRGRCYVVVDASVQSITPFTDRGFCRIAANVGTGDLVIGAWRTAADGADCVDCTTKVQFISPLFTAADGTTKIAEVQVDFVNK